MSDKMKHRLLNLGLMCVAVILLVGVVYRIDRLQADKANEDMAVVTDSTEISEPVEVVIEKEEVKVAAVAPKQEVKVAAEAPVVKAQSIKVVVETKPAAEKKPVETVKPADTAKKETKPASTTPKASTTTPTKAETKPTAQPKDEQHKGQIYIEGFGWVNDGSGGEGIQSESNGDYNKIIGSMN